MRKRIIIPTILLTGALAVGSVGVPRVWAQETNSTSFPLIVKKLAEKFNLKESDVSDVFKQVHEERAANWFSMWEQKLSQAVEDGKITSDQKKALIDKYYEVQDKLMQLKNVDPTERKTKSKEIFDDLQKWSDDQNIDLKKFGFGMFHPGFRKGFRLGAWNAKH